MSATVNKEFPYAEEKRLLKAALKKCDGLPSITTDHRATLIGLLKHNVKVGSDMTKAVQSFDAANATDDDKEDLLDTVNFYLEMSKKLHKAAAAAGTTANGIDSAEPTTTHLATYPWLKNALVVKDDIKSMKGSIDLEDQRKMWITRLKNKEVCPENVQYLTFTVFSADCPDWHGDSDLNTKVFLRLIRDFPPGPERMNYYNWYVAYCISQIKGQENFCMQHGARIDSCKFPMFPPVEELIDTNVELLRQAAAIDTEISGGDLDIYDKIPEVYRQSSPKDFITGGDVRQYVQQDENGVPYVDLTYLNDLLSDEFKFVKDQHAALKKKVSKLTGKKKKEEATQELKKMIMSVVNSKKRGSPSGGDAPANTVNLRTLMNQAKQMKKEVIVKADGSYHFQ